MLENVQLRPEAFDYLKLPVAIGAGSVGRLCIKVSFANAFAWAGAHERKKSSPWLLRFHGGGGRSLASRSSSSSLM